jgi:hypothetical protein
MMRFKWLSGDRDYLGCGGKWISNRFNNGEWNCYYVLELMNWIEAVGEREAREVGATYNVSLSVVSPDAVGKQELARALDCYGIDPSERETLNTLALVECLHGYGIKATIFDKSGNNAHKLMREARERANLSASFTFGFDLDKQANAIGNTGWDFLSGNIGFHRE